MQSKAVRSLSIIVGGIGVGVVVFALVFLAGRSGDATAEAPSTGAPNASPRPASPRRPNLPVVPGSDGAEAASAPEPTLAEPLTGTRSGACETCRASRCVGNELFADCKPMSGTVSGGRAAGKAKRGVCEAVVSCIAKADCTDQGDPRRCYCGSVEIGACLGGKGNGPCRAEIEDAAESTDAGEVASRWTETTFALAQAVHEVGCIRGMCKTECYSSAATP